MVARTLPGITDARSLIVTSVLAVLVGGGLLALIWWL